MKKKQFASKVTRLTMSMVLGASIIVPNMLPLYSQTVSANTQNTGILSAKDRGFSMPIHGRIFGTNPTGLIIKL